MGEEGAGSPQTAPPRPPGTPSGDRLGNGERRPNPDAPRPLRLELERAGAQEVEAVGRARWSARREALELRVSGREASVIGLQCASAAGLCQGRAPRRDSPRMRATHPTQGKRRPGSRAQASLGERNPGGGPRISGLGCNERPRRRQLPLERLQRKKRSWARPESLAGTLVMGPRT